MWDNGIQFLISEFTSACESYKVKILFTSPYHPQAKHVESINRNLKIMLSSYMQDNHRSWDNVLAQVAGAMRISKHEVTCQIPFYNNFGYDHCISGTDCQHPMHDQSVVLVRSNGF